MKDHPAEDSADRKKDHIELAFASDMANRITDSRFTYEPMLSGHPSRDLDISLDFLGKKLKAPLWVSSMTGGTQMAFDINQRLAKACARFGLGMGLGSCRSLLNNLERIEDFNVRPIIGDALPLYANLGIAQIEALVTSDETERIAVLIKQLQADGLIVHINPLQEWLQPEGDLIRIAPLDTIERLLDKVSFPVIIKEVGQGMGPESIHAILRLPVAAFEMAAHGGTNFSKLELLRSDRGQRDLFDAISHIGHSVEEMVSWINVLKMTNGGEFRCRQVIISGGIRDFLDGYYWMNKLHLSSVYGQASAFLRYAKESQEALDHFIENQIRGLQLARAYLKVK